jgi:hypothetical protein
MHLLELQLGRPPPPPPLLHWCYWYWMVRWDWLTRQAIQLIEKDMG